MKFLSPAIFAALLIGGMVALPFAFAGCKDATSAQFHAMGKTHTITVYSGGVAVRMFHSTGNVSNQEHTDGFYFEDRDTKKLVEVSGTVVIEQD